MDGWFFNSWGNILQAAVTAAAGFILLLIIGRIYGKRSTSRMNNFDWMVTVAVGAIFATTIIRKEVALMEGLGAIGVLLTLQFMVTFSVSHWKWAQWLFLSRPRLLFHSGDFREEAMKRERVARPEIISAVREGGLISMDEVHAVVLESNSVLSVVPTSEEGTIGVVDNVVGIDQLQAENQDAVDEQETSNISG